MKKKAVELAAEAELVQARARAEADFLAESRKREGEAQGLRAITEALKESPQALLTLESIKQQPEVAKGLAKSDSLIVVQAKPLVSLDRLRHCLKALMPSRNPEKKRVSFED